MERLNPDNLKVEYRDGVDKKEPVTGRKYTLTHSDLTGELFLTIGKEYATDKINRMRDEVLAEWKEYNGIPYLFVSVLVDGRYGRRASAIRNEVFRRELPLAIEAIRYGDRRFFTTHKELDQAPIRVYFESEFPEYQRYENWGMPLNYK